MTVQWQQLRDAVDDAEMAPMSPSNALFHAVTTSEQETLRSLQAELEQLKKFCLLHAEADMLRGAVASAKETSRRMRVLGESAVAAVRSIDSATVQMRTEVCVAHAKAQICVADTLRLPARNVALGEDGAHDDHGGVAGAPAEAEEAAAQA